MAKVPASVTKEQYLLKSTFFYNKLQSLGYFDLFMQIQKYATVEACLLNWDNRVKWGVSDEAWVIVEKNRIAPALIFVHPKTLKLNPTYLKYYRSIAMLPQKGLKAISSISMVNRIEDGNIEAGRLSEATVLTLTRTINEVVSLVVSLSANINESELQGMMYATAGTSIDGSWRNQIGAEGERVIRAIIVKELYLQREIVAIADKNSDIVSVDDVSIDVILSKIDDLKTITLINGYSILFSSEPDVTLYDDEGNIVGVIEIKSGLDPAGALERLGAMFKSFENTLAEYPDATTILIASCITDEVEARLGASMVVRQKYITTNITASDTEKRKFVNRLRVLMKLAKKAL